MATYTECPRCAGAPRRPTSGSALSLTIPSEHVVLCVPGKLACCMRPVFTSHIGLASKAEWTRHSQPSHPPLQVGRPFRGLLVHHSLRPAQLFASLADLTGNETTCISLQANLGFYFQAFSNSVTLLAAGYSYGSTWTFLPIGLAPIGTSASVTAPTSGRSLQPSAFSHQLLRKGNHF